MEKLDIVKITIENGLRTVITCATYDVEDGNNATRRNFLVERALTNEEAVEFVKTQIEPGKEIPVALNFEPLPSVENPV